MSHEISIVEGQNGRELAEAVFRNEPAWHGLGQLFDSSEGRLTSERAMELAHLDWHVSKRPLFTPKDAADAIGEKMPVPGFYTTVRDDINQPLGVVGERYRVFQNHEAFAWLDSLVMDGILEYESAMALQGGSKICLLARLPEIDDIAENDPVLRYLLLSTAHDGSGAIDILPTNVRVVCANTKRLALSQAKSAPYRASVRHTESMGANLARVREFILNAESAFQQQAELSRHLANVKVSRDESREFIEALFPAPEAAANEAPEIDTAWGIVLPTKVVTAKAVTMHRNKIADIRDSFRHPSNQLESIQGSWWQLYNAVSYYTDHDARTRGRTESARRENRFLNVTDGPGAALKDRAFRLACERSGAPALAV